MADYGRPTSRYTILDDRAQTLLCRDCSTDEGFTLPRADQAAHDLFHAKVQRDQAEADLTQAVADMRQAGKSWADVAQVLGVTRQSVWRMYGPATDVAS